MVINTEQCSFSESKIWPGKGSRFVSKDGKTHIFLNRKVASLFTQRLKPVKLRWTQSWRRQNKKGKSELQAKKRVRRAARVQKAIVGASLDDIKKRREERPEIRAMQREAALKEVKERGKKKATETHKEKEKHPKAPKAAKAPKAPKAKPAQKR